MQPLSLYLFIDVDHLFRGMSLGVTRAKMRRMDAEIWYTMSISNGMEVLVSAISVHGLVYRRSGRCPLVICTSHFDEVLYEFTNLKQAVSASIEIK